MRFTSRAVVAATVLLIFAAVLAVYVPYAGSPFLFDDALSIVENPSIRRLWPVHEAAMAPAQNPIAGRPLVNLTLGLNYAAGRLDPTGYHLVNIGLHLGCAVLLLLVLREALRQTAAREVASWIASAAALLWAVHPLLSEAVIYATQRTELMMALFYLATLYAAMRGFASASPSRRRAWFVLAAVACVLGALSKEVIVSAPLMVLLLDRQLFSRGFGDALRRHAGLYVGLAASWVVLGAIIATGPRDGSVGFHHGVSGWDYLLTQAQVLVWYLRLAVWPNPLLIHYEWAIVESIAEAWPHALAMTALLAVTVWGLVRRHPLALLGAGWFLVLGPTSSFVPIVTEVAAERRMYLPLVAVVLLVVLAVWRLLPRGRGVGVAMAGLVLALSAALAWATADRLQDYRSERAIWQAVLDVEPDNTSALNMVGLSLMRAGELEQAKAHFERVLTLSDGRALTRINMAMVHYRQGDLAAAEGQLRAARELFKDDAYVLLNLANVVAERGRVDEAFSIYQQAVEVAPHDPAVVYNLGVALQVRGDVEAAKRQFDRAIEIQPDYAPAYIGLAKLHRNAGDLPEALAMLLQAHEIEPTNATVLRDVSDVLWQLGRTDEAQAAIAEAAAVTPAEPKALAALGVAQDRLDLPEAAEQSFERALAVDPQHVPSLMFLGNLRSNAGRLEEAVALYERALEAKPEESAAVHDQLGVALMRINKPAAAAEHFRQSLALDQEKPARTRKRLAVALQQAGQHEAAAAEFERLIKDEPADVDARRRYVRLLLEQRKIDRALPHVRKIVELDPDDAAAREFLSRLEAGPSQ